VEPAIFLLFFIIFGMSQFACIENKNQLSTRNNFFGCSNNTTHKAKLEYQTGDMPLSKLSY
jgi:hypothetical protein